MGVSRSIGDGKATSILVTLGSLDLDNKFVTTYHPSLVGRTADSPPQMERKAWDVEEHWTKPISTKLKINVDGPSSKVRIGLALGSLETRPKFVQGQKSTWRGFSRDCQVVGMKEVLSWIKTMQVIDVEVETDSLVTARAINGSPQIPSRFGLIVQDCSLIIIRVTRCFYFFC
uniref:RNase H type-1 domain-containing protein n=1 Tax=Cannabis sativa TaxID=3483 RepID=A0A803QSF6_CANSA